MPNQTRVLSFICSTFIYRTNKIQYVDHKPKEIYCRLFGKKIILFLLTGAIYVAIFYSLGLSFPDLPFAIASSTAFSDTSSFGDI